MKILQTIHQFMPDKIGGSEVYTYNLCRELQAQNHDVLLLTCEDASDRPEFSVHRRSYRGLDAEVITHRRRFRTLRDSYSNPRINTLFSGLLDTYKPDIVHFQHLLHLSCDLPRITRERGIPSVLTLHEFWHQCLRNGQRLRRSGKICFDIKPRQCAVCLLTSGHFGLRPFRTRLAYAADWALRPFFGKSEESGQRNGCGGRAAQEVLAREDAMKKALLEVDKIFCPSRFLYDEFVRWGIPESRMIHSDYGFDISLLEEIETVQSEKFRFAFIGSLVPHKGVDILIKAFSLLSDPSAELNIYGDPNVLPGYTRQLKKLARSSSVVFRGSLKPERLRDAYRSIDTLIVPSRWFENSPLTIHEAFIAGIPVITSKLGGMAELVRDGKNGLLFDNDSASSLAQCMRRFLNEPGLKELLTREKTAVKTIREDADQIAAVYEECLRPAAAKNP